MKQALAAFAILAGSAVPALASDTIICADPPASPSIIYIGDPCDFVAKPDVADVEEEQSPAPNVALVDALGMPSKMPVVMRPSMDTGEGSTPAAAAAPATATAPAEPAAPQPAAANTDTPPAAPASAPAPASPPPPLAGSKGGSSPEIQ